MNMTGAKRAYSRTKYGEIDVKYIQPLDEKSKVYNLEFLL